MVAATGILAQPAKLANLLGASSTWQTLCGVSSMAHAARFVHVYMMDEAKGVDDDTTRWPRAIVSWQDGDTFGSTKVSRDSWMNTGSLTLSLELLVPPTYEKGTADAHNWFMNQVGSIVSEMQAAAGTGEPISGETHLNATEIQRQDGPWHVHDDEMEILDPDNFQTNHVMWIVLRVEYF